MNLTELQEKYNTHLKCIRHLEKVRWGKKPYCPHCNKENISVRGKRRKFKKKRIARVYKTPSYHCNSCNRDFTVLTGTIFEASKLPLSKWFAVIALMLNARKGISAMNIMRDLGITYKTAWFSAMRVRCAMLDQARMLEGIVEMDEAYIGGKPRHRKPPAHLATIGYRDFSTDDWRKDRWKFSGKKFRKGRGSDKVKVVDIVERGIDKGRVAFQVQDSLTGTEMLRLLKKYVNMKNTTVMTDDFSSYNRFDKVIQHYTVNHSEKEYVKHLEGIKDSIHTNTIEGVWSIIKNGIRGQYHVLSKKYLPFYLAEAAYKYNRRGKSEKRAAFGETIENAVTDKKCQVNYKPRRNVRKIVYGEKVGKKRPKKPKPARKPTRKRIPGTKIVKRTKQQWKDRAKYLNRTSTKERRKKSHLPYGKRGYSKKK